MLREHITLEPGHPIHAILEHTRKRIGSRTFEVIIVTVYDEIWHVREFEAMGTHTARTIAYKYLRRIRDNGYRHETREDTRA